MDKHIYLYFLNSKPIFVQISAFYLAFLARFAVIFFTADLPTVVLALALAGRGAMTLRIPRIKNSFGTIGN